MWKVLKTKAWAWSSGEVLRSTEFKYEVTKGKLNLLLKHNVMHVEKHNCE